MKTLICTDCFHKNVCGKHISKTDMQNNEKRFDKLVMEGCHLNMFRLNTVFTIYFPKNVNTIILN